LYGSEVSRSQIQLRVYLFGDPQKPNSRVFEQEILLPYRGAEELE
jgi:hypothetical protein